MTLKKILILEDEPDLQTILKIALEDVAGFEIKICSCAEEALSIALVFLPDLFTLDVMLPSMDGPTFYQLIKKNLILKDTPVIFMTAKNHPSEIDRLKKTGCLGIIKKPFDPMTLGSEIKQIWNQHFTSLQGIQNKK